MMRAPPGTAHAPLTRFAMFTLLFGAALFSVTGAARWVRLESMPAQVLEQAQLWRPWTAPLASASTASLLLVLWVLWRLGRHCERVLGPRRARRFALACVLLPPLGTLSLSLLASRDVASHGGATAWAMALLVCGARVTPLGPLDRVAAALVAVQLMVGGAPQSVAHAVVGVALGALWRLPRVPHK